MVEAISEGNEAWSEIVGKRNESFSSSSNYNARPWTRQHSTQKKNSFIWSSQVPPPLTLFLSLAHPLMYLSLFATCKKLWVRSPKARVCIDTRWHGPVGGCSWCVNDYSHHHTNHFFFRSHQNSYHAFIEEWYATLRLTCGTAPTCQWKSGGRWMHWNGYRQSHMEKRWGH